MQQALHEVQKKKKQEGEKRPRPQTWPTATHSTRDCQENHQPLGQPGTGSWAKRAAWRASQRRKRREKEEEKEKEKGAGHIRGAGMGMEATMEQQSRGQASREDSRQGTTCPPLY